MKPQIQIKKTENIATTKSKKFTVSQRTNFIIPGSELQNDTLHNPVVF